MMKRSGVIFIPLLAKSKSSPFLSSSSSSENENENKTISSLRLTASEAPELLEPYVEPTPFVSAKRLQVFLASMSVGAVTIGTIYYFLSKAMSKSQEEERLYVQRVVESNRLALMEPQTLVPDFTAPSSFTELKEKIKQHERELARQQEQIDRRTIMLHTEIVFRVKVWWNACLTHLQEAFDRLGVSIQKRKERAAVAHIKEILEEEGYELVKLRNGKTHIW